MNDYERGWIEALIDGEGCLGLYRQPRHKGRFLSFTPLLSISNTNRELLERAHSIIGSGSICQTRTYHKNHKPRYEFSTTAGGLRRLLPAIRLIAKERQRRLLLEALPLVDGRRHRNHPNPNLSYLLQIKSAFAELNKKGA